MKGWVGLVGWPTADVWPTKWSSVQLAVRRRSTSITAGAAANHAATAKSAKYTNLKSTHIFVPFVIETSGAWNAQLAIELTQEIGRRTTAVTGDPRETNHLFQRLSIAIQQANAVSFTSTFKSEWEPYPTVIAVSYTHLTLPTIYSV